MSDGRFQIGAALIVLMSAAGCAAHHTTTGVVLRIDKPGATVTISHDAFPGYMDAMAMPFDLTGSARAAFIRHTLWAL